MQPEFKISVVDGIVRIRADGEISAETGDSMMAAAAEAASNGAANRYIFDFRDAVLVESYERLYRRPNYAKSVGIDRLSKTAVLCKLPNEKFAFTEDVAFNRGIDVKLFEDEAAALAWLNC
jgi:hypothetical protein